MAKIKISSVRLKSILSNRHEDPSKVVKSLNLTVNLVDALEKDTEFEFVDIEQIAGYLKKPWSYLLIDHPEVIPNKDHDNRTLDNQKVPASPELLEELDSVNFILDTAVDVFPEDKVIRPSFRVSLDIDPEKIADSVRDFLGVALVDQLKCKDDYEALRLWSEAVQTKGIYVAQRHLDDTTVRAFSISKNDHAVMVIDTTDIPYARIFSMLHELCHILLKHTGICDFDDEISIERYCNGFAAAVLLPKDDLKRQLASFRFTNDLKQDEATVRQLSAYFRVSQAALMIRLNGLGLLSDGLHNKLETRRRARKTKKKSGGGDYYRTKINSVGRRYAKNVITALGEERINRADASVLLGVGEHLVDRYKTELSHITSGASVS